MPQYNVLFLCTGNSARSILAEGILNHRGRGSFTAYSAGCDPLGRVRSEALRQLVCSGIRTDGLCSKSWDKFFGPGAPQMDFVFTVCDNAAAQVSPAWPGSPARAHWGVPDPAAVLGTTDEIARAFHDAFVTLDRRIGMFLALPFDRLKPHDLQRKLEIIGQA